MALNKEILKKMLILTENKEEIQKFLLDIFQFESEACTWYKGQYSDILDKYCKEDIER
jgi:hypothetical protein